MRKKIVLIGLLWLAPFSARTVAAALAHAAPQGTPGSQVPELVRAAFPGAQTFSRQHHDLSPADISAIEKASNTRWSGERDSHSYLVIGTKNGKRAQLGVATVVENVGTAGNVMIAYDNDLKVTKVIAAQQGGDATSPAFLGQFAGKSHDDPIKLGQDIRYSGSNRATAAAITDAVRRVTATMQRLYGKAH